jgi:hypothetical protein
VGSGYARARRQSSARMTSCCTLHELHTTLAHSSAATRSPQDRTRRSWPARSPARSLRPLQHRDSPWRSESPGQAASLRTERAARAQHCAQTDQVNEHRLAVAAVAAVAGMLRHVSGPRVESRSATPHQPAAHRTPSSSPESSARIREPVRRFPAPALRSQGRLSARSSAQAGRHCGRAGSDVLRDESDRPAFGRYKRSPPALSVSFVLSPRSSAA